MSTCGVAQGSHLDAGRVHRDEQVGDARRAPPGWPGAHEGEDPVGMVGHRRPDLAARHPVDVAVADGACGQRREIAAGTGFGESLAPELFRAQQRLEETLLLFGGAVNDDRGRDDERQRAQMLGRTGFGDRTVVVELILERECHTADLFGPARRRQGMVDEFGLPRDRGLEPRAGRLGTGTPSEVVEQSGQSGTPVAASVGLERHRGLAFLHVTSRGDGAVDAGNRLPLNRTAIGVSRSGHRCPRRPRGRWPPLRIRGRGRARATCRRLP